MYRNIAMYSRRNVSSPMFVVCLFRGLRKFLWLCSKLEQVYPKRQNRKENVAECIGTHVKHIELYSCVLLTGKVKQFLEVETKRESAVSGNQNV